MVFRATVYHTEADVFPWHLGTLMSFAVHPLVSLTITLPVCATSFVKIAVAILFTQLDWLVVAILLFAQLILFALIVAILLQLVTHYEFMEKPTKRFKTWSEEVAVVTGGSSGIGWLLAKELAARGVRVAVLDIVEPMEPSYEQLISGQIRFYKSDITNREFLTSILNKVETDFAEEITILVNNAGVCSAKSLIDLKDSDIVRTFNVNALAHFWTVRHVLPKMIARRYGHIVTVASTMGLTGVADMTDYCASKFATVGFHESLRQEINRLPFKHLIHTTLLCPGLILTGMFKGIRIQTPFLTPPLTPKQVVGAVMDSLENMVGVPIDCDVASTGLDKALQQKPLSMSDLVKQHKVLWIPMTYYLPSMLNLFMPTFVTDLAKSVLGGNSAITKDFVGRKACN